MCRLEVPALDYSDAIRLSELTLLVNPLFTYLLSVISVFPK